MASSVSFIASLRELALREVALTGNQDDQCPEIRIVATRILDEVFPLQNIRRAIPLQEMEDASLAPFAPNSPM